MGFNDSTGNFWLGNELLHQVTKNGKYRLRFDLRSRTGRGNTAWRTVEYSTFVVFSEASRYMMLIGGYLGGWSDMLRYHNGARFTTYDRDNDGNATHNCAAATGGGFWWHRCLYCGVNTPVGSSMDFRWHYASTAYGLSMSRMWLTC